MNTTLKKLISEIDFKNQSMQDDVNWEDLTSCFNIYELPWSDDKRLKSYFIKTWYCTDSYVGIRAYFLDEKFVALSTQNGRKSSEEFEFVSIDIAKEVRDYLLSLIEKEDGLNIDILTEDELNQEISNTYKIQYNEQIRHASALLNGERVSIIKKHFNTQDDNHFHTVEIQKEDGEKLKIDCRKLDFKYNTLL